MKQSIHDALLAGFEEWPETVASPVPTTELDAAERDLGVTLPDDFREFISKYGAGLVRGRAILGLRIPEFLPHEPPYFTDQSKEFREILGTDYENIVVISVDDSGDPIGFLPPDRTIFVLDHDFGGRYDLAENFEDYLEKIIAGDENV